LIGLEPPKAKKLDSALNRRKDSRNDSRRERPKRQSKTGLQNENPNGNYRFARPTPRVFPDKAGFFGLLFMLFFMFLSLFFAYKFCLTAKNQI
jgi:hypothetical protein